MPPNAIFCRWYPLGSYGQIGSYLVLRRLGRYFEICWVLGFLEIMDIFQRMFGSLYSSVELGIISFVLSCSGKVVIF